MMIMSKDMTKSSNHFSACYFCQLLSKSIILDTFYHVEHYKKEQKSDSKSHLLIRYIYLSFFSQQDARIKKETRQQNGSIVYLETSLIRDLIAACSSAASFGTGRSPKINGLNGRQNKKVGKGLKVAQAIPTIPSEHKTNLKLRL